MNDFAYFEFLDTKGHFISQVETRDPKTHQTRQLTELEQRAKRFFRTFLGLSSQSEIPIRPVEEELALNLPKKGYPAIHRDGAVFQVKKKLRASS